MHTFKCVESTFIKYITRALIFQLPLMSRLQNINSIYMHTCANGLYFTCLVSKAYHYFQGPYVSNYKYNIPEQSIIMYFKALCSFHHVSSSLPPVVRMTSTNLESDQQTKTRLKQNINFPFD